jgi:6-phospho-3-hexuloisomerase
MDYLIENILAEITSCLHLVPGESLTEAGTMIEAAPKIFLAGAGRSGLIMRALGTRLMHLGKTVYVVGESTTPSIQAGELLILGSG